MDGQNKRGKFLKRAGLVILMGACAMLLSAQAGAVVIDHFEYDVDFGLTVTPTSPSDCITQTGLTGQSPATKNVLGGTRIVLLDYVADTGGAANGTADMFTAQSMLDYSNTSGFQSKLRLIYNGSDSSPWNLTAGGATFLKIVYIDSDLGSTTKCTLTDSLANTFTLSSSTPTGASIEYFMLAAFTGVDETSITRIEFEIDAIPSGDYQIHDLETGGNVPEPLTMLGMFLGLGGVGAYIRKRRMA